MSENGNDDGRWLCPFCQENHISMKVPGLTIDGNTLHRNGKKVKVSQTLVKLTEALAVKYPNVVKFEQILLYIYAGKDEPEDASNTLKVFCSHLRKFLPKIDMQIENEWSIGYRLVLDEDAKEESTRVYRRQPRNKLHEEELKLTRSMYESGYSVYRIARILRRSDRVLRSVILDMGIYDPRNPFYIEKSRQVYQYDANLHSIAPTDLSLEPE